MHVPCASEFWKNFKWSWIIKLEKKDLSGLAVLKSFFCVCEKWSVIFVISKFFLPTNILKRSAIADDRPLFATLRMVCKTTFLLTVTFYLTKAGNITKNFLTQLSYYCFEWRYYFCQNVDISKVKVVLVLFTRCIFLNYVCVCVLTHQISSF